MSPKVISSPFNGLTPSPSCRLPDPRPAGKTPIRFPRPPSRYRKVEFPREKASKRQAANPASMPLSNTGRAGSRQFGHSASDDLTFTRGRITSLRQSHRGHSIATTSSRSSTR